MFQFVRRAVAAGVCLAFAIPSLADEEHRQHGAHVHGVAQLNIALEGRVLEIELESPAMNLVGFEHAPTNEAEHAQLENVLAQLRRGESLFVLPAVAACRLEEAEISTGGTHHGHDEEAHHHESAEADAGEQHSDISAHYHFVCDSPAQLTGIDVKLFERFQATEVLDVQYIGPTGQRAARLTHDNPQLRF